MKQIELLDLHSLRNNEHYQFMTDVDKLILRLTANELGLESSYPAFHTALGNEDSCMRTANGSDKSGLLDVYDQKRDQIWSAIRMKVEATIWSPIVAEAESALRLKRVLEQYGNMRKLSYNEESAALTNLTTDLKAPSIAEDLVKVGIHRWTDELQKGNEAFLQVFEERTEEYADRDGGDVRAARLIIDPMYESIVDRINAVMVLEMAGPAAITFANNLNELIRYSKNVVATRRGKKKSKTISADEA